MAYAHAQKANHVTPLTGSLTPLYHGAFLIRETGIITGQGCTAGSSWTDTSVPPSQILSPWENRSAGFYLPHEVPAITLVAFHWSFVWFSLFRAFTQQKKHKTLQKGLLRRLSHLYNRPFPSCFEPHCDSEAMCIHSYANKTNFHVKSLARSLAFIMRFTATRKWPIV